jgi:hypothetical protein
MNDRLRMMNCSAHCCTILHNFFCVFDVLPCDAIITINSSCHFSLHCCCFDTNISISLKTIQYDNCNIRTNHILSCASWWAYQLRTTFHKLGFTNSCLQTNSITHQSYLYDRRCIVQTPAAQLFKDAVNTCNGTLGQMKYGRVAVFARANMLFFQVC